MKISNPEVLLMIQTIKNIQKRMKDPDCMNIQYMDLYDKLGREFNWFSDTYTTIFTMVIRGENMQMVGTILFYRDKVLNGLMTEEELGDLLSAKFLPIDLKKESDQKIKLMKSEK